MLAQTKPGALVVGATFPVKVVDVDAAQRRISVEMVGDKRVVTPNAVGTIDDLKELVPNLAASLSVLEPMAQAKKVVQNGTSAHRQFSTWSLSAAKVSVCELADTSFSARYADRVFRVDDVGVVRDVTMARPLCGTWPGMA